MLVYSIDFYLIAQLFAICFLETILYYLLLLILNSAWIQKPNTPQLHNVTGRPRNSKQLAVFKEM